MCNLSEGLAQDRLEWGNRIQAADPSLLGLGFDHDHDHDADLSQLMHTIFWCKSHVLDIQTSVINIVHP